MRILVGIIVGFLLAGRYVDPPEPVVVRVEVPKLVPQPAVVALPPQCVLFDGRHGPEVAAELYCAAGKGGGCCGQFQTWTCNNADYVDWHAHTCGGR